MTSTIVIPLHSRGGKFRDNSELRFALRSLEKNFIGDFEVVIVSEKIPPWIQGVRHLHGGGLKEALRIAAREYPDGFFWWYDDNCLLLPTDAETMKVTPAARHWSKPETKWRKQLDKVRARLVEEGHTAVDYSSPHGPYWFDLTMVEEGFSDWPNLRGKFPVESWILSKRAWPATRGETRQYYGPFKNAPSTKHRYLNYNDRGNTSELRMMLGLKFPRPSRFESDSAGGGWEIPLSGNPSPKKPLPVAPEKAPRGVCFIHVPKTAGTSISNALGTHMRVKVDGHPTSHFSVSHPKVQQRIRKGDVPFAVVRNPYDRAWSLYKFFHKHKEDRPRLDRLAEAFMSKRDVNDFWLRSDVEAISKILPHFRTQSSFLDSSVRLLRFENLDSDWSVFAKERGLKETLPRLQVSEGIPWQEALSDEVREVVAALYDEDFVNFGYDK